MATTESQEKEIAISQDVIDVINKGQQLGSKKLDLSKRSIGRIPSELIYSLKLEYLYLEGNSLSSLPDDLFSNVPNLKWLDLRNNHLSHLPASIGELRSLRSLLLENNNLQDLPLELGFAKSLSGIHLAGNPLEFPPIHITEQGAQVIVAFLRDEWLRRNQMNHDLDLFKETDNIQTILSECQISKEVSGKERAHENSRNPTPPSPIKFPKINDSQGLVRNFCHGESYREIESLKSPSVVDEVVHVTVSRSAEAVSARKQKAKHPSRYDSKVPENKGNTMPSKNSTKNDFPRRRTTETQNKTPKRNVGKLKQSKSHSKSKIEIKANAAETGAVELKYENTTPEEASVRQVIEERERETLMVEMEVGKVEEEKPIGKELRPERRQSTASAEKGGKVDVGQLKVGEMVAIKVSEKHFIPGQPCLGKIVSLQDATGYLVVHYYSGSYDGAWRPMMSRSSPYLRRVSALKVLCKFNLNEDSRMSAETIEKVIQAVKSD